MESKALKQAKVKTWVGGLQVQLSTTMSHYVVYINLSLMGMMFWYTTGGPTLRPYLPWASFWMFAIFMVLIVAIVMVLDYKFMYPSRQGFLNKQAYKHANPVAADIRKIMATQEAIIAELKVIKEKLGIREER